MLGDDVSAMNSKSSTREKQLIAGNWLSFLVTVGLNALGSTGMISGKGVGEVSDMYPTRFTPASSAFSIWGLIYFGVAVYLVMQLFGLRSPSSRQTLADISPWFMASGVCNSVWILLFVWGNPITTWISVPFLFGLLVCLIVMSRKADFWNQPRKSVLETIFLDGTFSIYAGWATVASIVNVAAALVSVGWKGEPWTEVGWTILMMSVAAGINILIVVLRNNSVWALVYTWAVYWIARANEDDAVVYPTALVLASLVAALAVGNILRNVWLRCTASRSQDELLTAGL